MNFTPNSAVSLDDIPTPALLLDRSRLETNCSLMLERMRGHGVQLRPHLKTAKSADVARIACGQEQGAITVSTLNEALWFAQQGFHDLLYAVGFSPAKLDQAIEVQEAGAKLSLITDHPEVAEQLGSRSLAGGCRFPVLIEVDCGHGRGGVLPESDALVKIGRVLTESAGTSLAGVLTHAGQSYQCSSIAAIKAVAEQERVAVVRAASRLRAAALPCPVVSAGSTPTAIHTDFLQGITEMRPGVYQFGDLAQVCLGSCKLEDIAISVLATVIGHNESRGRVLIDAGALALSKDKSASQYRDDWGYGLVCDITGRLVEPPAWVGDLEQEHGFIDAENSADLFDRLPVGCRLRILPNHACMTGAAYPGYWVTEAAANVSREFWPRCNGWQQVNQINCSSTILCSSE